MTTIDYKALAERIEAIAKRQIDGARLSATQENDEQAKRFEERAADLRTVVSLLEGMAEEKPVAWMRPDNRVREESFTGKQFSRGEQRPPIGTWVPLYLDVALRLQQHKSRAALERMAENARELGLDYEPQPQPERQPVSEAHREAVLGAVARGWCHPENANKEMDATLAIAIADEVLAINRSEPTEAHPMLCATHYCKDCAALWRQCDDFSFTLRSQACCTACNNAPVGGQLFALTTPVAMPRPSEPTEAQIEVRNALAALLLYVEGNECRHETTHRGGAIWTICDDCDRGWADDEGGFEPYEEPAVITRARAALAAKE